MLVVSVIKKSALRMRPVVALAPSLSSVHRHYPTMQNVLNHSLVAFESFPSGDVAGAMVFAFVLFLYGGGVWVWLLVALSALGRLYFHAHHLFDTVVGAAIAVVCTTILSSIYGLEEGMGSKHSFASLCVFATYHLISEKSKAKSIVIPEEYRKKKGSIYGEGQANETPQLR